MSDERALQAAIIAHPEEDTPRLAYADWLDEHDDPDRAEFIRVQCRLADLPPSEPEWVDLIERQDELVARLLHRRLTHVAELPDRFYFGTDLLDAHEEAFRRGFPYFIDCQISGTQWNRAAVARAGADLERLTRTTTLRGFQPYGTPPPLLTELLASPVIAELNGLALSPEPTSTGWRTELVAYYRRLVTNPSLRGVKHLYLYRGTPPGAVAELIRAETFDAVVRLTIQNLEGTKTALGKLTRAAWFRRLKHFRTHLIGPEIAVPVVTGLGWLPELHTLELPQFASGAVAALAETEFPALARLIYGYDSSLKPDCAQLLAGARFPALVAFEASDSGLTNTGLAELLKGAWFERLRVLELPGSGIGDRGVKALVEHPVAKELRKLRLGNNPFGATGLAALAAPGALPVLSTLDLHSHGKRKVAPADLAAFLSKLQLPTLRHLDLSGWPLGTAGAKALAENPTLAGLTRLGLDACGIGDPGARALFASPHLRNLVELYLSNNAIKSGADALADPAVMPRLGSCRLEGNRITNATVQKVTRQGLYLQA
jgi:uncharacterized protein (TIGR02996 family)